MPIYQCHRIGTKTEVINGQEVTIKVHSEPDRADYGPRQRLSHHHGKATNAASFMAAADIMNKVTIAKLNRGKLTSKPRWNFAGVHRAKAKVGS